MRPKRTIAGVATTLCALAWATGYWSVEASDGQMGEARELGAVEDAGQEDMQASPHKVRVQQPDGTELQLGFRGRPGNTYYVDAAGYAIVETPRHLVYALRGPGGTLVPSPIDAGSCDPALAGLRPGLGASVREASFESKEITESLRSGEKLVLSQHGSGSSAWYEDERGFAVIEVPRSYVYALRDAEGSFRATTLLAGRVDPERAGLVPIVPPAAPAKSDGR